MTSFTGRAGVSTFQAIAVKGALKLYRDTGMRANRAYTPKNMMAMATQITGEKFKARDYTGAIDALQLWLDANGRAHD